MEYITTALLPRTFCADNALGGVALSLSEYWEEHRKIAHETCTKTYPENTGQIFVSLAALESKSYFQFKKK